MSFALVNHALTQPLPPARRAVLLTLADSANHAGTCWPSVATIARRACMSVRSVFNHLAQLVKAGLIQRRARIGRSSLYTIWQAPAPGSLATDPAGQPNEATSAPAGQDMPTHATADATPPRPAIAPTLTVCNVVQAMRAAGLVGAYVCQPLADLVATATSVTEFTESASHAAQRGKGFAWALARVAGKRKDASRAAAEQAPATPCNEAARPGRDPVLIQIEQDDARATQPPASIRAHLAQLRATITGGART